jgi:hypothetical protein
MPRKRLSVLDGPLKNEVYQLDLLPGDETRLRLEDGRAAVYRAEVSPDEADSTGRHVCCLRFVRIEDPSLPAG